MCLNGEVMNMAGDVMKEAVCPPCGLMIKSYEEKDIANLMIYHAKVKHNAILTEKDVSTQLKVAA